MRTIKFRAWDNANKIMINPYCELKDNRFFGEDLTNTGLNTPTSVMQFTGLFDKNGVEIYEGDILIDVEFDENNNDISGKYPVVYDSSKCQFAIDNSFKKDGSSLVNFIEYFGVENLEVVGNIHDNPEMLFSF